MMTTTMIATPAGRLAPVEQVAQEFAALAPQMLLFLGVLIGGVVLAAIARTLTKWLVRRSGLETLGERFGVSKMLYAVGIKSGVSQALGGVAWFACILFTITACAEVAGLDVIASGVGLLTSFLPRLLAAAGVLVGGVALATALRSVLRRLARGRTDVDEPDAVASVAYYLVVTIAAVMAADQAGLQTELVGTLVTIVVGVAAASVGFSFAAAASRGALANLIAAHYLRRAIRPGDTVRSQGHRGTLRKLTAAHTVIETAEGLIMLPNGSVLAGELLVQPPKRTPTPASGEPSSPNP